MQKRRILDSFHSATNGPFTRQDLIQDNTKAEDVSLLGAFADRHQLWCHPVKGPNLLQAMDDSKAAMALTVPTPTAADPKQNTLHHVHDDLCLWCATQQVIYASWKLSLHVLAVNDTA